MKTNLTLMKKCTRCGLPETYETIQYDEHGICSICRNAEHKVANFDWTKRKSELDDLIEKHRNKAEYDCIVPFSGGKDSTFQLLYLIREYRIKPLVVRFNHGFLRPTVRENTTRTLKKLGADFLEFTPNWRIVKRLMLESFRRKSDFCWHCHTGIYSFPIRVAIMYQIPLVIWGETQSHITAYYNDLRGGIEYEDERKFNMLRTLGISAQDMHGMINTPENPVDIRDLLPYTFPSAKEVQKLGLESVPLGSFIPWDYDANSKEIREQVGWTSDEIESAPAFINQHGEKIECFMQGTRDYVKFIKRGYSRVTQINAFRARKGEVDYESLLEQNELFDGRRPPSLDLFLEYVGLTEEEFRIIAQQNQVPPYAHEFENEEWTEPLWDMNTWFRES